MQRLMSERLVDVSKSWYIEKWKLEVKIGIKIILLRSIMLKSLSNRYIFNFIFLKLLYLL